MNKLNFYDFEDFNYTVIDPLGDKSIFESSNDVFCYNVPFCKHCSSSKVVKTGYNTRELYTIEDEKIHVNVQRYNCKLR